MQLVNVNNLKHNYKFMMHFTKFKHYTKKIDYCSLIFRYNYRGIREY